MTSRPKLLALLLIGLLAGGVGGFLLAVRRGGKLSEGPQVAVPTETTSSREPAAEEAVELVPPVEVRQPVGGDTRTNVLWPLKVELELVEARYLPKEEGVLPIGSGASARLMGEIKGSDEEPVAAEVSFVAGANAGRILHTDERGAFGASDLYPGLSIVEIRGTAISGSRREVRLRRGQETLLNIGYGRPAGVQGMVQDGEGVGIPGAAVVVDGTRATTGAEGEFYLSSVAAGQVLVEVEAPGYALYQELVYITAGMVNPVDRMTFTLKPAASLSVAITNDVGGPGPAQLYLFSDRSGAPMTAASARRNESYPWHKKNPIEVYPGRPVTIDGLPNEVVKVHAFRPGTSGALKVVNLRGDRPYQLEMALEAAPIVSGRVLRDGEPVAGATVKLEAPDRVRATLAYFREASYYLEAAVMPNLPPALQEVTTGKDGRFSLTAWVDESPVRYIEARGPDGRTWAGRFVRPKEQEIDLQLTEVDLGDSELVLEFPGRFQGLPVELWIGGTPYDPQVIPADEPLRVSKLLAGRWRLKITWHAQPVHEDADLVIEDTTRFDVQLPIECIQGQDEHAWRRAGREYPLN